MIGGGCHAPKAKVVGDLPEGRNHPLGLLKGLNEIQYPSLFSRKFYHTVLVNTVHQDGFLSSPNRDRADRSPDSLPANRDPRNTAWIAATEFLERFHATRCAWTDRSRLRRPATPITRAII